MGRASPWKTALTGRQTGFDLVLLARTSCPDDLVRLTADGRSRTTTRIRSFRCAKIAETLRSSPGDFARKKLVHYLQKFRRGRRAPSRTTVAPDRVGPAPGVDCRRTEGRGRAHDQKRNFSRASKASPPPEEQPEEDELAALPSIRFY